MPSTLRPFSAIRELRSILGLVSSKASRTLVAIASILATSAALLGAVGINTRSSFAYAAAAIAV